MFILPGLLGLVTFIYTRPLDFLPALRGIPFLYLFVFAGLAGFGADVGAGKNKFVPSPHLRLVLAMLGWCIVTVAIKASHHLVPAIIELAIVLILFFLMAHGIRTIKAFERMTSVVLWCTLWISLVCAHQGLQHPSCVALPLNAGHTAAGTPTGVPCVDIISCFEDLDPDPELEYHCEHVGWFGLSSVKHRVRYAGVLHDPNEVSLAVAVGVPLAIARYQRHRKKRFYDLLMLILTLVLTGLTVVLSKSRGGQLVFMAVLGIYFLRRYKVAGLFISGIAAAPLMLLGGRSGAEASASSMERLECWEAGLHMMLGNPVMGVGFRQFLQYHHLTAHNSFVLAAGELGIVGMTMFTGMLIFCVKIAWESLKVLEQEPAEAEEGATEAEDKKEGAEGEGEAEDLDADPPMDPDARYALKAWAEAMLASMSAMAVGVFFLSFVYHYVLWIYFGIIGAFYGALQTHKPSFKVKMEPKEFAAVLVGNIALVIVMLTYIRRKLG